MEKITYRCKKCQWEAAIPKAWGDLRPKMCMGRKCLTNFLANPDALEVIVPQKPTIDLPKPEEKPSKKAKKEEKEDGRE